MNETQLAYFKDSDILHLLISEEAEANSVGIGAGKATGFAEKGSLM